jgi:hypothetical protein
MARFVIHRAEAFRVTRGIAREFVAKVMREVEAGAKVEAAHGEYVTGRLAASVRSDGPYVTPDRVWGRVGSRLAYARAAERGARPHLILPRRVGGKLKFFWRKVGRTVYLDAVSHPGMQGKRWLEKPLRAAARRHNMRVREISL